jgi:hypothetical protein
MNEFNIMPKRKIHKVEDSCCGDKFLFNMAEKYVQFLTGAKPKVNKRVLSKPLLDHKPNQDKGCF